MTRRSLFLIATSAILSSALGFGIARARDVPQVATGFVASLVCAETFVSGLDPDAVLSETTDAMPGTWLLTWAMTVHVDRAARDVTVSLLGAGRSHAAYRDGLGCTLDHGDGIAGLTVPAERVPALLPAIAPPSMVTPPTPELAAALDRAFAEPDAPPFRRTHAVVVVKDGRLIAERYAKGYGIDTPLLGFSATKSVTSALIGILVREHKLAPHVPVPVAAWQHEDDPRHAITIDRLLRHTAGLALGSSLQASLLSALEPVNRMQYGENDMAAFAESAPLATAPGTAWNYHDGNYMILSQLIRNASGGAPDSALRFAQHELFGPLGMNNVILQVDASGTIVGSGQMLASARDWACFGLLYLNDGVIGGRRILPEGWVDYSAAPTARAFVGYGAGFWTNRDDSFGAIYRIAHGWPRDAFFAKGTMGQYVIVIPSEHLVIARFGRTVNWPLDADGVSELVRDVVAATKGMKVAGAPE
jgi:CubicO group peptidase (beta-lactamase class C family)